MEGENDSLGNGKTYPNSTGSNTGATDTKLTLQPAEGANKPVKTVLGSKVERGVDSGRVAGDAADEDERALLLLERPVADGELAQPNGVGQVHIDHGVVARLAVGDVPGDGRRVGFTLGGGPEGGPGGLEETGAGDDNVHGGEALDGFVEEGSEIRP